MVETMRKVFISDIPIISCVSTEFYRVVLTIQKLLGHESIDTTQIYTNLDDEYLKKEYDKIQK